jgi:predicted transcriptional regulator
MVTIRVPTDTRNRLVCLKENPKESLDTVINRLIDFYEDDDPLTREDIEAIKEALQDVKDGRTYTSEQLKKELGLT